jgi:DNA polymerase III epsilon subunit-like protein
MIDTTKTLVFFDTETTGIIKDNNNQITSNGDLIQLAYKKIESGTTQTENIYVNTDTKMEIGAIATHGIYPKLLQERSEGKYIAEVSIDGSVFADNVLVAHNAIFDTSVMEAVGVNCSDTVIDTLKVAKILLSEGVFEEIKGDNPEYVNMQYLRYYFELYEILDDNGNAEVTTAHDALGDVIVLERVFEAMFTIIKEKSGLSNDEIIDMMIRMTNKEYLLIKNMAFGKYRGQSFEEVAKRDAGYLNWIIGADFTDDIKYTCSVWV